MTNSLPNMEFINKLKEFILANISDERFGVKELAKAAGMNYFHLNRKLHSSLNKNTSQFIREIRLERAKEMLEHEEITAAEVAYKVGFGSPAYFNRCFHEYFGYPPGETKNRNNTDSEIKNEIFENQSIEEEYHGQKKPARKIIVYAAGGFLLLLTVYLLFNNLSFEKFSLIPGKKLKSEDKSIAVLPFKSLSSDDENQYFSEGVTENIQNNLIKIKEIKVVTSISLKELSENPWNMQSIANKLGVGFLLTGSVQRSGTRILVIVQLSDAKNDQLVWSDKYDRELSDIFNIQSDIAKQVALALQVVITAKEMERIDMVPTTNMDAYSQYLLGRYFLNRKGVEDIDRSAEYFMKAIAADSSYAEAYAGMADVLFFQAYWKQIPRPLGYILAKKYALKALALDENLAEPNATLGALLIWYEWKWEEAREQLLLAIELNPNCPTAHQYYAELLCILNDNKNARDEFNRALELNSSSPWLYMNSAEFYLAEGNYEAALEECRKSIEINPKFYATYYINFDTYLHLGENLKAVESLQKGFSLIPVDIIYVDTIKEVYEKYGMNRLLNWLINYEFTDIEWGIFGAAQKYAILEEKQKSLDCLEKAFEMRTPNLPKINYYSEFKILRNEPRFQALLDSMNLTPYQSKEINSTVIKK